MREQSSPSTASSTTPKHATGSILCGACSLAAAPRPPPGIYSRAYVERRIHAPQVHNFRREFGSAASPVGLASYPHPWLMPEFWQYPTVSMGLGPIMAIYQARFMRYLEHRGLLPATDRK